MLRTFLFPQWTTLRGRGISTCSNGFLYRNSHLTASSNAPFKTTKIYSIYLGDNSSSINDLTKRCPCKSFVKSLICANQLQV